MKHLKVLFYLISTVLVVYAVCVGDIFGFFSDNIGITLRIIVDKRPVVTELSQPKNFFVDQSNLINFSSYASAWDENEGDISHNISYGVSPVFELGKSGRYEITYTASNSKGAVSYPLKVNILVWDFVKVVSGYYHTLALGSNGRLYVWGDNYYGQLGTGKNNPSNTPILIDTVGEIVDIAAGSNCSYALTANGEIFAWGDNACGQLGDGTLNSKNKPTKVVVPDSVRFAKIYAGIATVAGLTDNGEVYIWGDGENGALADGKTSNASYPQKTSLVNIVEMSISQFHGAAIDKDGKLYTWGNNVYESLGIVSVTGIFLPRQVTYFSGKRVKQISAGWLHMSAITDEDKVYTWGFGGYGALGSGTTDSRKTPLPVSLAKTPKKVIAGANYTSVIAIDGSLYFFGSNDYGKHGSGNTDTHLAPYLLSSITDVTDVALGISSSSVLSAGKAIYSMGYGNSGGLGTGKNESSTTPLKWAFSPPAPY